MRSTYYVLLSLIIVIAVARSFMWPIRSKRRSKSIRNIGHLLGWQFKDDSEGPQLLQHLNRFKFFRMGRYRRIWNISINESATGSHYLFDYQFVVGLARATRIIRQTTICFQEPSLQLPAFRLRPKGFNLFARKKKYAIDFSAYPSFSKKYGVYGVQEGEARKLFSPALIQHLSASEGWYIEGRGDQLILGLWNKQVEPEDLSTFLKQTQAIKAMICQEHASGSW